MVSYDGAVKLLDFGIARATTRDAQDAGRHAQGQGPVHVARAVQGAAARSAQRSVLARHRAVRADRRPAAVPRRQRLRDHGSDRLSGRAAAVVARQPDYPADARGDRDEAARARAEGALHDRRGAGRRSRRVHPAPRPVAVAEAARQVHAHGVRRSHRRVGGSGAARRAVHAARRRSRSRRRASSRS